MAKRAPDPNKYFADLAWKLRMEHPDVYVQILHFEFRPWDGGCMVHQRSLGGDIVKKLGNPHGYAVSTLVTNTRKAMLQIERDERLSRAQRI